MRRLPAILLALVALAVLLVAGVGRGSDGYHVAIVLESGSQLVKGDRITVGGRQVGLIDELVLRDDNLAEVHATLHDRALLPLHEGTTATVRIPSLASVANRYIALDPGPNSAPALADGATIPVERTASPVEVDALLNTLDAQTRGALRGVVRGGAEQYGDAAPRANAALARLNPALAELEATAAQVGDSSAQLGRLLASTAAVASAVDAHRPALQQAITGTSALAASLAGARGDVDGALAAAPRALRAATATLRRADHTARALAPFARSARTAAPAAGRLVAALRPAVANAAASAPALQGLARDLLPVLRGMPALSAAAVPALQAAGGSLAAAGPIIAAARAYTPDLIGGVLGGLGGGTSGYYDANGHYLRLGINGSLLSTVGLGSLLPTGMLRDSPLMFTKAGRDARCPGAGTQKAGDGSNPWLTPEAPCRAGDSP